MKGSVVINCFPSSVNQYRRGYAIVAIDVIRATTVAITGVALGRRCFVADTLESARGMAAIYPDALMAGELGGVMPEGFDMNNSPAELIRRKDVERPLILLSTSGTQLAHYASRCEQTAYLASFRNFTAVARWIAGRHERVAIIGAGSRNEFREEDQMCCAWVAKQLVSSGYVSENRETMEIIQCWSGVPPSACSLSNSVAYLRRTGQLEDFEFILAHIDDLDVAYTMQGDEVVTAEVATRLDKGREFVLDRSVIRYPERVAQLPPAATAGVDDPPRPALENP